MSFPHSMRESVFFLQQHLPAITCLLSGQGGNLYSGTRRHFGACYSYTPRSRRRRRSSCRRKHSVRRTRWNPSTIHIRYRSYHTSHRCSGFSALQDEISFRCYRYTIRQNQDYHCQRNGNFDLLLQHTAILQL